jgi:hypothetical protein
MHGSLAGTRNWGADVIDYDANAGHIVVLPLNKAPLMQLNEDQLFNWDEGPLGTKEEVKLVSCGTTVSAGRQATSTFTSLFSASKVLFTQIMLRGDSVTAAGTRCTALSLVSLVP